MVPLLVPFIVCQDMPLRIGMNTGKLANCTGECDMRQRQGERETSFSDNCIPPSYAPCALAFLIITQAGIQRRHRRCSARFYATLLKFKNWIGCSDELVVVLNPSLVVTTLDT